MYQEYLWQTLNEMYYGKHPYFNIIEKYIKQLKNIIIKYKKNNLGIFNKDNYGFAYDLSDIKNVKVPSTTVKKVSEDDLPPNIRARMKPIEDIKNESVYLLLNYKKYLLQEKFDNKNYDYMAKAILNAVKSSEYSNFDMPKQYENIHRQIATSYDFSSDDVILWAEKNKDYSQETGQFSMYFIPEVEDQQAYASLISNLCSTISNVFKFPKCSIDIMNPGDTSLNLNAFCIESDKLNSYLQFKSLEKLSTEDSKARYREWINKRRLYQFKSNNNSIYFGKFNSSYIHIILTSHLFMYLTEKEILAIILHEIGHVFGLRLLPIEFRFNMIIQEKFADAFATKFGYAEYLLSGIKKINYSTSLLTISAVLNRYKYNLSLNIEELTNIKLSDYIKFKIIIALSSSKLGINVMTTGVSDSYDLHPLLKYRQGEQLSHLTVELDNPRISNQKKKELQNNIKSVKRIINKNEIDITVQHADEVKSRFPQVRIEEKNALIQCGPEVIRDILDKIYDQTMRK